MPEVLGKSEQGGLWVKSKCLSCGKEFKKRITLWCDPKGVRICANCKLRGEYKDSAETTAEIVD